MPAKHFVLWRVRKVLSDLQSPAVEQRDRIIYGSRQRGKRQLFSAGCCEVIIGPGCVDVCVRFFGEYVSLGEIVDEGCDILKTCLPTMKLCRRRGKLHHNSAF